jgi:hypothetical protein
MRAAAREMRFEDAARWRDEMRRVEALLLRAGGDGSADAPAEPAPDAAKIASRSRPSRPRRR